VGFEVGEPSLPASSKPDLTDKAGELEGNCRISEGLEDRDRLPDTPAQTAPPENSDLPAPVELAEPASPETSKAPTPVEAVDLASCGVAEITLPPPIPEVVDVRDLDWLAVGQAVDPGAIRARMRPIVEAMESLLDRSGGPGMLFDADRAGAGDKAVRISAPIEEPLWFIGDLHGDLLALESALSCIRRETADDGPQPRVLFLGDFFDDEGFGLEVLLRIFELIVQDPGSIAIITGNHDEALHYDGTRFGSTVDPSDFAEFLNGNLSHEWIERAGKLAVRLFAQAPRAFFFPDGLLATHGGFPLADLHPGLLETGDWNNPACLTDFTWARAHPKARKKLPNRYGRGSQFGYEDFAAFCRLSAALRRPVTHMVRGHDHVDDRYAIYPAYRATPVLTMVALSRRLPREGFGPYERAPTLARYVEGAVPQVYRLHISSELVGQVYPRPATDDEDASVQEAGT
jgi:Calcineurin-like phosphoesterase